MSEEAEAPRGSAHGHTASESGSWDSMQGFFHEPHRALCARAVGTVGHKALPWSLGAGYLQGDADI